MRGGRRGEGSVERRESVEQLESLSLSTLAKR